MNTSRKIDIYMDGEYVYSTNQARTCKDAVARIRQQSKLTVASVPHKTYAILPGAKIRAHYAKATP